MIFSLCEIWCFFWLSCCLSPAPPPLQFSERLVPARARLLHTLISFLFLSFLLHEPVYIYIIMFAYLFVGVPLLAIVMASSLCFPLLRIRSCSQVSSVFFVSVQPLYQLLLFARVCFHRFPTSSIRYRAFRRRPTHLSRSVFGSFVVSLRSFILRHPIYFVLDCFLGLHIAAGTHT